MSVVPRRSQEQVVLDGESGLEDQISFLTGLSCDPLEDQARQEFGPEVTVEAVLRRHGGGALMPARPMGAFGGVVDFDVDLTAALGMVADARRMYAEAPQELREKFPTFGEFVQAAESGRVGVREATPAPTPPQRVVIVSEGSSGDS